MAVMFPTRSLALFCLRWAGRLGAAYFVIRFVVSIPLAISHGGGVVTLLDPLLFLSVGLFTVGALLSSRLSIEGLQPIRRPFEKAFLGGIALCVAGWGFNYLNTPSSDGVEKYILLSVWGDVLYAALALLTLIALGYCVSWLNDLGKSGVIRQQTWWMGMVGVAGVMLSWAIPASAYYGYGLPITFMLLIGIGWSYALSQLCIVIERGADVPASPITSPFD